MEIRNPPPLCAYCLRPIEYDLASGFWIHKGYRKVDGMNGLFCSPGMWDETEEKKYAKPI